MTQNLKNTKEPYELSVKVSSGIRNIRPLKKNFYMQKEFWFCDYPFKSYLIFKFPKQQSINGLEAM